MRRLFIAIMVGMMGVVFCFLLFRYNVLGIKRDSVMESLEKSSEAAMMASLDGSYRLLESGMNLVSGSLYEATFEALFEAKVTGAIRYEYLYLMSDDQITANPDALIAQGVCVKGIKTSVEIDGEVYAVRMILDVKKGLD